MTEFSNGLERAEYSLQKAKQDFKILCETMHIDYERMAWLSFLMSIDAVRQALIGIFNADKKQHSKWYSAFCNDYKKDPLLVYMRNARNNSGHIVTHTPLNNGIGMTLKDKNGIPFPVDSIAYTESDGTVKISIEAKNLPEDFEPDGKVFRCRAIALPVLNDGITYQVPYIHKNVIMSSCDITLFADMSIEYYDGILETAKQYCSKA